MFLTIPNIQQISVVQTYLKRVDMFRNQSEKFGESFDYDSVVTIDLGQVHVSVSGPKKAKDRVALSEVAKDFKKCLKESYSSGMPSDSIYFSLLFCLKLLFCRECISMNNILPHRGGCSLSFLHVTPSSWLRTIEWLFKVPSTFASFKETVSCEKANR